MFIYRGCHSTGEALAILCCQTAGGRPNPERELPNERAPSEDDFRKKHSGGDFDCSMKPDNSLREELAELLREHRNTVEWSGKLRIAEQFARPKGRGIVVVGHVEEARASTAVTSSSSGEAGTILWSAEPIQAACHMGSIHIVRNLTDYLTEGKKSGPVFPVTAVTEALNEALRQTGWDERY